MKKLFIGLALVISAALGVCPRAKAQGTPYRETVRTTAGPVAPGATATVCSYTAAQYTAGAYTGPIPCSPTVTVYNEPTLSVSESNPITANFRGEFFFYANAGDYTITEQGAGLVSKGFHAVLPCVASSPNTNCGSASSAQPAGSTNSVQYNAGGSPAVLGGACPPSAAGLWNLIYNMTTATTVAPSCLQPGLAMRSVTGSTSTDTILGDGNATNGVLDQVVYYESSANVGVTLPTPTSLGNLHATIILANRTSTTSETVTVTPSGGLTIGGGSTLVINQAYVCRIEVDPTGNWDSDCFAPPLIMGAGMSQSCTANGCTLASSGNLVPQVNGTNTSSVTPLNFENGTNITVSNPSVGNVQFALTGPIPNATLANSATTANGTSCTLGSACVVPQATAIPNASSTGTSANHLAKLTGAPYNAVLTATTDTSGAIGVCISGCGTTGNAVIQQAGVVTIASSNNVTTGHYAQQSTTTGGSVMDVGSACPASGQIIGQFTETASSGAVTMMLFPPWGVPCPEPPSGLSYNSSTSFVTTTIATSATQLLTVSVTMPASGCPCRAMVSYAFMYTVSSQQTVGAWITDGSNSFANSQGGVNAANLTNFGLQSSDVSPVTYNNNASVTFSVEAETSGGTVTAAAPTYSGTQYLHVLVIASN